MREGGQRASRPLATLTMCASSIRYHSVSQSVGRGRLRERTDGWTDATYGMDQIRVTYFPRIKGMGKAYKASTVGI